MFVLYQNINKLDNDLYSKLKSQHSNGQTLKIKTRKNYNQIRCLIHMNSFFIFFSKTIVRLK